MTAITEKSAAATEERKQADERTAIDTEPPAQAPCSEPGRGRGRPFKPGQSGNPGGRPKKVQELARLAQKHCDTAILYARVLLQDNDGRVAIAAATFLRDTAMGKPTSAGKRLHEVSDEELHAEIERRKLFCDPK